jgi:hypothetical protein
MVIRVYKVKYELALELSSEEAEKLADFLERNICNLEDDSPRYYISDDFDEDDLNNKQLFKLLKPLQGEEIVIAW